MLDIRMIKAIIRHLQYLFWHKVYVFRAGIRLGVPLRQLIVHDWSKFLPSEFIPYTRHFFVTPTKGTLEEFRQAFILHWSRNPHHWEYWGGREMPRRYVLEMLADWEGSGWAKNGRNDTSSWYKSNRLRILIHPATRTLVESELCCSKCQAVIESNMALIIDGEYLTDGQISQVKSYVRGLHTGH